MDIRYLPQLQLRPSKRTIVGLLIIFPLLLLLDYGFLLSFAKQTANNTLNSRLDTIQGDIDFKNGQWNVSKLYDDTLGPEPYIVMANDGLLVDHGTVLPGFFDKVDTTALQNIRQLSTKQTTAGVRWRLLAKPVEQNGKAIGIVAVGSDLGDLADVPPVVDPALDQGTTQIASKLSINPNGDVSTDNLRLRDVHPLISAFGVVTAEGQLLSPTLGAFPFQVTDAELKQAKDMVGHLTTFRPSSSQYDYLVAARELKDDRGQSAGVALVATSFETSERLLEAQVNVVGILLAVFAGVLVVFSAPRFMVRRGTLSAKQAISIGENNRIEFKEVLPAGNSLAKHVAGLANTEGGAVYIGITDDGRIVGVEATLENDRKQRAGQGGDRTQKGLHTIDQLERHILNDLRNLISPAPDMEIERLPNDSKTVLRISIRRSRNTVHTVGGVIYVRHGNQTLPAKAEEILRIVRARV